MTTNEKLKTTSKADIALLNILDYASEVVSLQLTIVQLVTDEDQ